MLAANEKRLLYVLGIILILCGAGLFIFLRYNLALVPIEKEIKSVETNLKAIPKDKIDPKELPLKIAEIDKVLTRERGKSYAQNETNISEFGLRVKKLIRTHRLTEQSVKTIQSGGKVSLQFQLRGHALDFAGFLKSVSTNDKYWKIEELFIKSPRTNASVEVTMRITYETVNSGAR